MGIDLETTVYVIGLGACLVASLFLYSRGERWAGMALSLGFVLLMQSVIYMACADSPVGDGGCWLEKGFYECLPLEARISIHAGQAGSYVLAIGVFLMAVSSKRRVENGS